MSRARVGIGSALVALAAIAWIALRARTESGPAAISPSGEGALESAADEARAPEPQHRATRTAGAEPVDAVELPRVEPADTTDGALGPRATGRVVDPEGEPVPGARVLGLAADAWSSGALDVEPFLFHGDQGPPRETRTGADGRFALELPAGPARLAVRDGRHAPFDLDELEVAAEGATELGDLVLEPGLALEGRVVDARGAGVPDARIDREDPGPGGFGPRARHAELAVTDADGRFRAGGLRPGAWSLRVRHAEFPVAFFSGIRDEPGASDGHVFALEDGWTIEGRLVVPGVDDFSIYSVSAKLLEPPEELGELVTEHRYGSVQCAADGAFRFTGLRALDATTRFELEPRRTSGRLVRRVGDAVEAHAGASGVVLRGEALATVLFELRDRETGAPIAEPQVWLVVQGGNHVDLTERGSVEALGGGRFRVADLERASEGADFALHFAAEGYRDHFRSGLGLAPGASSDLGIVELERPCVLALELVDHATGAPGAGASVTRDAPSRSYHAAIATGPSVPYDAQQERAESGADGVARLPLAIGHLNRVFVEHPEHAPPEPLIVEATVSGELRRRIRLTAGATVVARVLDADGRPATEESVVVESLVERPRPRFGEPPRIEEVGEDGLARLAHLRPGPARVKLLSAPDEEEGVLLELVEGATHELELAASSRADLEGTVRELGEPLAGARLSLLAAGSDPWSSEALELRAAETDHRGRFRFEALEVGDYELLVTHAARLLGAHQSVSVREGAPSLAIELDVASVAGELADAEGRPVPGARVLLWLAASDFEGFVAGQADYRDADAGESGYGYARTDERGRFELRGAPPGVAVRAVGLAPGHAPARSGELVLDAGERREIGRLAAEAGARLRATLALPEGEARRSWFYELRATRPGGSAPRRGSFDRSGLCTLDHLEPGPWQVELFERFGKDERIAGESLDLAAGEERELRWKPR